MENEITKSFENAIQLDHLTNEQIDEIFNMFGDK